MLYGEHATCQAEAEYPELWDGLVGAWSPCLSPRGGTILRDLSGVGNHGTLTNMEPESDWVLSGGEGALSFDGTDEHVTIAKSVVPTGALPKTLSIWFMCTGTISTRQWLIYAGTESAARRFCIEIESSKFALNYFTNALQSSQTLVANRLYHCAAVARTGTSISVFVDGVETAGTAEATLNTGTTATTYLGRFTTSTLYFTGLMFDVGAWNLALTSQDVSKLHRLGPGGWATPRRRRWNYATAQTAIPYWVFARKNARIIGGGVS